MGIYISYTYNRYILYTYCIIYNRICICDVCIHILYIHYTHIIHTHTTYTYPIGSFSLEISDQYRYYYSVLQMKKMKFPSPTGNKGYTSRWFLSDFMSGTYHWHLYDVPFPLRFIFGRERKKEDVNKGKSVENGKESWGGRKMAGSIDSHKVSSLSFLKMS